MPVAIFYRATLLQSAACAITLLSVSFSMSATLVYRVKTTHSIVSSFSSPSNSLYPVIYHYHTSATPTVLNGASHTMVNSTNAIIIVNNNAEGY